MANVKINGIPVFDAVISDEETGMFKISLVDSPAVMSNFLSFDNNRKVQMYQVENDEKRLVRGVVMRADFPIYRYDKNFGEYYVIYKAEQIRVMAEKYLAEARQNDVNVDHSTDVEGVQMVQYFIKGDGISVEGFEDIADGSLFAEFHILNDEVWEAVKDGSYKGFSLEGVFDLVPEKDKSGVEEIVDSLAGAFSRIFNKTNKMGRMNRLKAALLKAFAAEFNSMTTDKGVISWDGEEEIKVGDQVYIVDAEGNAVPATDGDYKTEDGKTIVVAEGKVLEIIDPEVEVAPETEAEPTEETIAEEAEPTAEEETPEAEPEYTSVATDKGELFYIGELAIGTEVFVADEEGNKTPAEEGDYTLENGNVLKVAEGKVAEIVEPTVEEEDAPAEDIEAIKAENEALKAQIAELSAQIETLKAQPMAHAAHEIVKTSASFEKTGDKGLDRLARILNS